VCICSRVVSSSASQLPGANTCTGGTRGAHIGTAPLQSSWLSAPLVPACGHNRLMFVQKSSHLCGLVLARAANSLHELGPQCTLSLAHTVDSTSLLSLLLGRNRSLTEGATTYLLGRWRPHPLDMAAENLGAPVGRSRCAHHRVREGGRGGGQLARKVTWAQDSSHK
jgi:hypothetical protein